MENNKDLLQIEIEKARSLLSQKSREAIDVSNWKAVIRLEMIGKYSELQLNDLEIETELLLCGLINPDNYPKELETRMRLSKDTVKILINEMDKLVFKKIQKELERKLENDIPKPYPNKQSPPDPYFKDMPKNVQEAIALSDWKSKLYTIAEKYKLNVEQMGVFEEMTTKVILNTIRPDKY